MFGGGQIRVLGVDPGLTRCGVGVVDGSPGRGLRPVAYSVIRTPASEETAYRLLALQRELEGWIGEHRPDVVAVERVFAQHNVRTVMATAQAAAIAITTAAAAGITVAWHTPSEVKAAVSGNGRAEKAQVTAMVTRLLKLDAPPTPADAADALALAICALWRGASTQRLTTAAAAAQARILAAQARATAARAQPPTARAGKQPPRPTHAAGSVAG